MDMIFDTATGQLSIDTSSVRPWGDDLRAALNRHGQKVNLKGVEMHISVTADGETVFDVALPPPGVRYKHTDQDVLATGRVRWRPDQQIEVSAWCKTNSGHEVTAEASFIAPRPAQPYPSWEWQDGRWTPPVPYPDGAGDWQWGAGAGEWQWDEDAGDWALNINTADAETLAERLPGVGASLAQAIVDGRPWADPGDLAQIGGISEAMVEGWQVSPGLAV